MPQKNTKQDIKIFNYLNAILNELPRPKGRGIQLGLVVI